MLKALIQLFAEMFLQSKSEWVASQGFPERRVQLSPELTQYVPPHDGYIGIYKNSANTGKFIDVYALNATNSIFARLCVGFTEGLTTYSEIIPVRKGCKVVIANATNSIQELWFSPAIGSDK